MLLVKETSVLPVCQLETLTSDVSVYFNGTDQFQDLRII